MSSQVMIRAASLRDGDKECQFLQSVAPDENGFLNPATPEDLATPEAFAKFLQQKVDESNGVNLPTGHVPATLYWIEQQGVIVGLAKLRHRLNDKLRNEGGGHLGIGGIPQSYRGQGIATQAVKLLMQELRKHGVDKLLYTVDESNTASRRIAEKFGGTIEKAIDQPGNPGEKEVFYWIDLTEAHDKTEDSTKEAAI